MDLLQGCSESNSDSKDSNRIKKDRIGQCLQGREDNHYGEEGRISLSVHSRLYRINRYFEVFSGEIAPNQQQLSLILAPSRQKTTHFPTHDDVFIGWHQLVALQSVAGWLRMAGKFWGGGDGPRKNKDVAKSPWLSALGVLRVFVSAQNLKLIALVDNARPDCK